MKNEIFYTPKLSLFYVEYRPSFTFLRREMISGHNSTEIIICLYNDTRTPLFFFHIMCPCDSLFQDKKTVGNNYISNKLYLQFSIKYNFLHDLNDEV